VKDLLHRRRRKHKSGQGICFPQFVCYCTMSTAAGTCSNIKACCNFQTCSAHKPRPCTMSVCSRKGHICVPQQYVTQCVCAAGRFIGTGTKSEGAAVSLTGLDARLSTLQRQDLRQLSSCLHARVWSSLVHTESACMSQPSAECVPCRCSLRFGLETLQM